MIFRELALKLVIISWKQPKSNNSYLLLLLLHRKISELYFFVYTLATFSQREEIVPRSSTKESNYK